MEKTAIEASTPHRKMADLRMACEREIRIQRQRADLAATSFRQSLHSIKSMIDETLTNREMVGKLKDYYKELETDLDKTLAVKSCKEAKHAAIGESLSITLAKIEQLKNIVKDRKAKKEKCAAAVSRQLVALETLEEESTNDIIDTNNVEEVIMWYKHILGFRTEGGEGVKFIFSNIDLNQPDKEYSFTIRLDGDVYTLLHCDLHFEDISQLIKGLNKTNALFEFVRIMRKRFLAAALNGSLPESELTDQHVSTFIVSSPPPTSVDSRSETPVKHDGSHFQSKEAGCGPPSRLISKKAAILSPRFMSAPRRSPRFLANPMR